MSSAMLGLFPGQGSQSIGMGKEFYEKTTIGKELFDRADAALGFSLSDACFEGPIERLTETAVTQPAILTVSTISYTLCKDLTPLKVALGHSLGEYSALVAAGALDFEEAVVLVHKRGKYMQEAVPQGQGKMLAILGKSVEEVEDFLAQVNSGVAEIANINAPGQIVVSGDAEGIDALQRVLKDVKYKALPVSAPFHCSLMRNAAERLYKELEAIKIIRPEFPVYSNFYAKPLEDPERIREALYLQVCGRVRFTECVMHAIETFNIATCYEFGAGKVLSGLMKRISPEATSTALNSLQPIADLNSSIVANG
jgi:[acyl-carrier-protein] S-malonyltransferase